MPLIVIILGPHIENDEFRIAGIFPDQFLRVRRGQKRLLRSGKTNIEEHYA